MSGTMMLFALFSVVGLVGIVNILGSSDIFLKCKDMLPRWIARHCFGDVSCFGFWVGFVFACNFRFGDYSPTWLWIRPFMWGGVVSALSVAFWEMIAFHRRFP